MEALMSAQEAMQLLGVKRSFMTDHCAELGGIKVGSRLKFRASEIEAYLARQRAGSPLFEVESTPAPKRRGRIVDMYPAGSINPVTKLPWEATA